ncbi:MAG: GHKL domain-containing protein [Blautia sp.]|nr:GHKL domain-containing protein [Blautia sp.]
MSSTQIWNTPSYYYAISYWLSATLLISLNRNRINGWKKWAAEAGAFAAVLIFMILTDGVQQILFLLTMLTIVVGIYLYFRAICGFEDMVTVFYTIKAFIVGELCASLCWQITYYVYDLLDGKGRQVLMVCLYALLYLFVMLIERYRQIDMEEMHLTKREIFILAFLALTVYTVSNLSYVSRDSIFSGSMAKDIFNIRTLVDLAGVILIYTFQLQLKEVQTRFEKDTLQNIMNMQYQSYQLSQESIDVVNQKYHDLKHQITLLKAETDSAKATKKLERMEREIRIYETQNKTGNRVLDTVLATKSLYCQNNGIELKFIVDGKLLGFMDEMDISALFGNMLDNAIESVKTLEDKEKRLIWLYVSREKQFLRIRMENYCEEKIKFRGGLPLTNKKDKHLHGYGMKSMKKTVEHYHGSLCTDLEDNRFRLMILIPLPEQYLQD